MTSTWQTRSLSLEDYPHLALAVQLITKYLWIVPVVFGIPGNILAGMVAFQKHNRNVSTCTYMLGLSVADSLFLMQMVWQFPISYHDPHGYFSEHQDIILKLSWYFQFTFAMISGYVLAVMSIDRLIAVRFPMAARRICTISRAKKVTIGGFVVIAILNLNTFYTFKFVDNEVTGVKTLILSVPENEVVEIMTSSFQLVCGTILPFTTITLSNFIIIVTVKQASKNRLKMGTNAEIDNQQKAETQHLTRMLVCVCIGYIVTSLPLRFHYLIHGIPEVSSRYDMTKPYWNLRYMLENGVTFLVWISNYACNFYIYCLGGGRRYRNDTKAVLKQIFAIFYRKQASY
ncbi:C-C chemokine receptor type 7-like [Lineus longissimus]|uniref:C-C chemokine receptor type 7-like n=1 Tax=Lineus longissimus TaxID=88925 RepID=UPI002B4D1B35